MMISKGPKIVLVVCLVAFCFHVDGWEDCDDIHYTNSWAVHIEDGDAHVANRIAKRHGFINLGQVGSLPGYYHFVHKPVIGRRKRREVDKAELLLNEKEVKWVEQQQVLERDKRSIIPDFVGIEHPRAVIVQDPMFKDQWYLNNIGQSSGPPNLDINVLPVWSKGITGKGVVVAILDDGLDYTHPDLIKNYDSKASYDFNDYDNDPMPRTSDPTNCHGTKCAGEVAAESGNGICGVGVAFNSSIGGIRMLDGNTTDTIEGSSLSYRNNYIHIYSCAWGPKDDGKRFGRPGTLASKALQLGAKEGRGGLGSIFVWATGNGGLTDDDCNCDGYTTSIYTVSIGAISDHGLSTYYTESCASTLAVTYSGGSHREKSENKIITTTLNHKCTDQFKGTSSAAPLAAGMIALMLEANAKLTWRDVQAVIVDTALMTSPLDEGWRRNGAGKWFNQKFGFGRMDASQLVTKAKNWDNLPEQRKCWGNKNDGPWKIPEAGTLLVPTNASACSDTALEIRSIEHVQLVMSLKHRHRGHLSIELISPSGTRSQILKTRRNDHSNKGLKDWIFMSVHFWGEDPRGTWTLAITDNSNNNRRHYRSKVKHGDLEDATEALQDELMGRPRPQDEDSEGSSQPHEGVLDKSEKSGKSEKSEHNSGTELSEDFEGGIFASKSYRSSRKHSKKKNKGKRKKKSKKKNKKGKEKRKKHHKHHFSHKKSKPTVRTKEITFEPTFLGKTFDALTKNKPGHYHPLPTQSRNAPSYMTQNRLPPGNNQTGHAASQGTLSQDTTLPVQFQLPNAGQEQGSQSSVLGVNPDQSLKPTTRHNFETTTTSSQHDVIQGLVKSVLAELFTALRAQRNESLLSDANIGSQMQGKANAKEPVENVSTTLTKAWRSEKGVRKINSLISILDKVKSMNLRGNLSDVEANGTRADEMVTDVLKVLRDILSASKGDDKAKEFKSRVAKLVSDSSNETRNLTQKLFDDLQLADDGNRTTLVINDALSLISHIFQDDSQKKKSVGPPVSAQDEGTVLGQIGIILRRPDGSLIIPNPGNLQVSSSPENIIRTWSNASQIETVRIEHTKVSPINIANVGPKPVDTGAVNASLGSEKIQSAIGGKGVEKMKEESEGGEIEMEVERSGDGRPKDFKEIDYNGGGGRETGTRPEHGAGTLLNLRTNGDIGEENFKTGLSLPAVGPVQNKFAGTGNREISGIRNLGVEDLDAAKLHAKNKVSGLGIADQGGPQPDHDQQKSVSPDDQIDVTVFFDNNTDQEFLNEVNKIKSESNRNKKHGKFTSKPNAHGIDDFTIQKASRKSGRKRVGKSHGRHFLRVPVGAVIQPPEPEEDDSSENPEEEENSRSKGEIPDGDVEEEEEGDSPTPSMYDMRESLPFFSVPVADQHGYSLLTQVFDPYQDTPYPPGYDLVGGDEQAPLIEDDTDYYEPQAFRHAWKRSLQESLPTERKFSAMSPKTTIKTALNRQSARNLLRQRREISDGRNFPRIGKLPIDYIPSLRVKSKRTTDVASARERFAELVRKVHERSVKRRSLLGLNNLPSARLFGRHTLLSESANLPARQSRLRHRRSVIPNGVEPKQLTIRQPSVGRSRSSRRRRSIGEAEPIGKPHSDAERLSNVTVYREKRDKIIDDYDDDENSDFENEPHVVKRSAIFGSLDSSSTEMTGSEKGGEESRSKRQTDDDNEDEDDGERRQMTSERRVSSLEETLRKKLLSMKTQSKSVLRLLKRVHEDISGGNTDDLFKLEAEIANIEKREKKLGKDSEKEDKRSRKDKSHKKKETHRNHDKVDEMLKTKSVTPDMKLNAQFTSDRSYNDDTDTVEAQEKLAYKQNPDEYLKYGAGNTGVLESWTLVFYGT